MLFLFLMLMVYFMFVGPDFPGLNRPGMNQPGGQGNQVQSPGTGQGAGGPAPTPSTAAPGASPGLGTTMPTISARDYSTGSAPLTMTGAFTFDPASRHEVLVGHSDGERTNLWYGIDPYDPDGFIEIAFSSVGDEGFGLTIFRDPWVATYLGQGCTWQVEVIEALVSGHISCSGIPAENQADNRTGTVDIELDFVANTR